MSANPSNGQGIGASVLRTEDKRFLTGRGRYTDDINLPRQLYASVVRSPEAHAKIVSIETEAAAAAPGVAGVFTAKDLEADGVNPLPAGWLIHSKDGSPMVELGHPAMASDRVRHVGDPVAVVLASTKDQAKAAAMLVDVEYDPLPAVGTLGAAIREGAPLIYEEAPGNVCFDWEIGDEAATNAAFEGAAHTVSLDLENQRLAPNAIEPRVALDFTEPPRRPLDPLRVRLRVA